MIFKILKMPNSERIQKLLEIDIKLHNKICKIPKVNKVRLFHPLNSLVVTRNLWLILLSEI
jgi:hypothetical protein